MRCPPPLEIQSYVDTELTPVRTAQIGSHLGRCQACRDLARELATAASLLQMLAEAPPSPGRSLTARAGRANPRRARLRWALLPAAACLLLALSIIATWRVFSPAKGDEAYISAFVEAHREAPVGESILASCDFGMGGQWQ